MEELAAALHTKVRKRHFEKQIVPRASRRVFVRKPQNSTLTLKFLVLKCAFFVSCFLVGLPNNYTAPRYGTDTEIDPYELLKRYEMTPFK